MTILENGLVWMIGSLTILYIRFIYIYFKNDQIKQKKEEREYMVPKKKKAGSHHPLDDYQAGFLNLHLKNWKLLAGGLALLAFGILLNPTVIPWSFHNVYWWFFSSIGILLLSFSFN